MIAKVKVGVLGSGKGSNFVALAQAAQHPDCPYEISPVLTDVADAPILARAAEFNIPAHYIPPGQFRTKLDEGAEKAFLAALVQAELQWVALAGFMRILKGEFLRAFPHRVVNIHPALLPSFPGLEAWKQALDYGVKVAGCTVHFVDHGVDTGPILAQQTVTVLENDTAATLHARIQEAERTLYPATLAAITRGPLQVQGRRCLLNPS